MRKIVCGGFLACLCLAPTAAWALLDSCVVASVPVAFSSYNPLSGATVTSSGTVVLTCTGVTVLGLTSINVDYTVVLSTGGATSFSPRQLAWLTNRLNYNLYKDASYSQIWGDGTGGSTTVTGGIHQSGLLVTSVTVNIPVYASIPASQNVPSGAYTDTVTVTVNY